MAVMASFPGTKPERHRSGGTPGLVIVAMLFCACKAGPLYIADLAPKSNQDANSPPDLPPDLPSNPLLNGLVAHWSLDETGGTIATDRSGHGYNGTVTGATWTPGYFNGALQFNFGNEIVVPSFKEATKAWSVALWVRPAVEDFVPQFVTLLSTEITFMAATATTPGRQGGGWQMNLWTPSLGATGYQFGYWLGPLVGDYYAADCRCSIADQWTHIAGVVDGTAGTLSFYVNGAFQSMGVYSVGDPTNQPIKPGTSSLYIGRWATAGRLFKGELDDIVVYDRALTADEVFMLYQAPAPDPP